MNRYLGVAVIVLASAGAAWGQTIVPCTDPDTDLSGACDAAPSTIAPGMSDQSSSTSSGSATTAIDPGVTSAIPQPTAPQGMPPLVVPNDPLGTAINQNPLGSSNSIGGSQGSINGNSAISWPAIR